MSTGEPQPLGLAGVTPLRPSHLKPMWVVEYFSVLHEKWFPYAGPYLEASQAADVARKLEERQSTFEARVISIRDSAWVWTVQHVTVHSTYVPPSREE